MHPPLRILRASVDDTPGRQPQLSPQEIDRQDRIVEAAGRLLCQFGREGMTLRMIAASLRLTPAMVERHFLDFDSLMGEVFTRHLQSLLAAMEKIPPAASDKQAARRAVYAARTRNGFGAHTAMHALFIRQRGSLPDDISQPLDQLRLAVGAVLSREHGDAVLNLLDSLTLDLPKIEAFIRLLEGPASVAPDVAPAYTPEPVLTEALIASMFRPDPSLADHDLLEDRDLEEIGLATEKRPRKPPSRREQELSSATFIHARAGPASRPSPVQTGSARKRLLELASRPTKTSPH